MRCNWLRWLWGLPLLGLLIAYTFLSTRDTIETDVQARAESALQAAGYSWAKTKLDGRDVVIVGQAYEREEQVQATELLRGLYSVRVADDRSALIEEAEQYVWSADRDNSVIRLTGFVPNGRSRKLIVSETKRLFPGVDVIDEMKPARGSPPENVWLGGVRFGLSQLTRLEPGSSVNLRNAEFVIDGQAQSVTDFKQVRGALAQALPQGITLQSDRVRPARVSPYTWSARYDGSRVTFEGYATNDAEKMQLIEAAKKAFPSAAIVDRMVIADGAPAGWLDAALALVNSMSPLKTAQATMTDGEARVIGLAEKEATAADVAASYGRILPDGYDVSHDIKFVVPTIPTVQPYPTAVEVDEQTVRLSGYVPNEASRQSLLDTAARSFPDRRIVDDLGIAIGQLKTWQTCLDLGMGALAKLGGGQLRLTDAKMRIAGETDDEELGAALPGELRAATSRTCETDVALRVNRKPEPNLQWFAEKTEDKIVLSGDLPDSTTREQLLERAQTLFPNHTIEDKTRVVPSNGLRWRQVALTGLNMLGRLRSGRAGLTGQVLSVTGEAPDAAAASEIRQRLRKALADGYTGGGQVTVRSDAMIWAEREAKRKAAEVEAQRIAAEKRAIEEERRLAALEVERERQRLIEERRRAEAAAEAARKAKAEAKRLAALEAERERQRLIDEQRRAKAAAEAEAARKAKAEAQRLAAVAALAAQREQARLDQQRQERLAAERRAKAEQQRLAALEAERERLRILEEEKRRAAAKAAWEKAAREKAARRDAEERERQQREDERRIQLQLAQARCEVALEEVRTGEKINFALGKATIKSQSFGLLDRLAKTLRACNDVVVEIEGHTDSQGSESLNLDLSQRRADAVYRYLVRVGVASDQLKARGFGESRPIASNETQEGRARNRRIEFVVRENG